MQYLAQYTYDVTTETGASNNLSATTLVVYLLVGLIALVGLAKMFMKAGRQWWEAIIPIYSTYVLLKIIDRPWWWLLLLLIPFINIIFAVIVSIDLAKAFGRGVGTGLLIIFFPFVMYPLMGFSDSYTYTKPVRTA